MFNSLIHSNDKLPVILKFHYLRSSLVGKASALIRNIEFTEQNYKVALQVLIDKYENKRLIIQNIVANLFDLGTTCSCRKKEKTTAKGIESMFNKINQSLQSLDALKVDTKSWDPIILHLITANFDSLTLADWENTQSSKEVANKEEILEFLQKRLRVLESLERHQPLNPEKHNSVPFHEKRVFPQKRKPTNPILGFMQPNFKKTRFSSDRGFKGRKCPYCSGQHPLISCITFKKLSLPDRYKIVDSESLCRQCLKMHAGECNNRSCDICSGKHNVLLHPAKTQSSHQLPSNSRQNSQDVQSPADNI